jgi:hypothetical protein
MWMETVGTAGIAADIARGAASGSRWRGAASAACAGALLLALAIPARAAAPCAQAAALPARALAAASAAAPEASAFALPGAPALPEAPELPEAPVPPGAPALAGAPALPGALVAAWRPATSAAGEDGMRESVRTALAEAAAAKRDAQKLSGEERERALAEVTARYAAIAEEAGYSAAGRAEAAFRAGELLRGARRTDEATVMYARATELGAGAEGGGEFAARGLLEAAHLRRRAKDVAGALALYAEVRERFPGETRSAAHAVTWQGKLQLQSDQREQGIATLLGFRELFPEYPAEAVRNADLVALEQLEAGDETGARRTVEEIRTAMESIVAEGGKRAESVSKALAAMRVTEQLAGD